LAVFALLISAMAFAQGAPIGAWCGGSYGAEGTNFGPNSSVSFEKDFTEPCKKMLSLAPYFNDNAISKHYADGNTARSRHLHQDRARRGLPRRDRQLPAPARKSVSTGRSASSQRLAAPRHPRA